jgi:ATP-dependent protease ClpP protease subunit
MLLMALQKGGEKLGYESEAFAIYDTMKYIKPSVRTLCVGTAFGESAMLLAAGEKVCQSCCQFVVSRVLFTVLFQRRPLVYIENSSYVLHM